MINIWDYQEIEGKVKVTCIDGQVIIGDVGDVNDVEDEAEGGLTEDSIDIYKDGRIICIPQSEIASIEVLSDEYLK